MARRYKQTEQKKSLLKEVLQYIMLIVVTLSLSFLLKLYVIDGVSVVGRSMSPTLKDGQNLFMYRLGDINRFDVVILKSPDYTFDEKGHQKVYVKRVIGMPGDTLEYRNDKLIINGTVYEEKYLDAARQELGYDNKLMQDKTLEEMLRQVRANYPNLPPENTTLTQVDGKMVIPEGYYLVLGDNRLNSHDGDDFGLASRSLIEGKAVLRWWPLNDFGIAPF
ncbi:MULTISPECIES: signal peptidase I [unclassified Granulicatella]|uniref:signal peptidase I n=1 Tax=unclassified Granulicatella TaxID=2630493 RepID=UPI00107334A4|nr:MULTISPECIES: signal peptidase I [unclassified Granulicatella]MBF0780576.1 signal peptidase I [Granulicatella sp. 19428wC4_WM01]TFU94927.1 signal peptidase I [Granulicatella sp. WM01]